MWDHLTEIYKKQIDFHNESESSTFKWKVYLFKIVINHNFLHSRYLLDLLYF